VGCSTEKKKKYTATASTTTMKIAIKTTEIERPVSFRRFVLVFRFLTLMVFLGLR
jgi:hypothetical protein